MRTLYLLSLLLCITFSSCTTTTYWPVGGLAYGDFGPNITASEDPFFLAQFMHLAILYINNYSNLLPPDVKFQMTYYNTLGDNTQGVIDAFQLADISHVRGVAGGTFSSEAVAEATVLQYFKVPQNSGTASFGGLSDKSQYPYFFRVSYADYGQSIAVLVTLKSFDYNEVVVLYSVDDFGIGCRTAFVENAANYSITPTAISIPASASSSSDFDAVLSQVKATKINVIVIFCQLSQGTPLIIRANATGLIGPKYVWVVCDTLTYQYQTPSAAGFDPKILDGMIGIEEPSGFGPLYEEVWQIYNTLDPNVWWGAGSNVDPGYPSWYTFDSMYVFAVGLAKLLNAGTPIQNITNEMYKEALFGLSFTGTTGYIAFDENGDRQGAYLIYNWHNGGTNLTNTMTIEANMSYVVLAPTHFYGETTVIPPDTDPVCSCLNGGTCSDLGNADNKCLCPSGYSGDLCETYSKGADVRTIVIAIVVPVVGVMTAILVSAYYYYRKKRFHLIKSVAEKQKSDLPRNDILLGERIGRGASGEVFRGQLRGTDVAIKKFIINGLSNDALDQFTLESSMMCGLRHPNVVLFMGSCCDMKTKEMLLVMEFMNRGSLYDVIHNKKVFLSYELKLHLALQTAQGINFLHQSSPPILHRDIKSHNILLDDKWTARISDFGITIPSTKGGDDHNVGTIYWTAVEVLNGQRYTEKSDCYSFGIVLYELFHNKDPYPGRDAMVVASQVISSGLRPTIDPSKVPYEVRSLMESCWATDPDLRPTFKEVVARLKQLATEHPMLPNSLMQDNVSAPTGTVFLVKTMVENALSLWDSAPRAMASAMILHNDILRNALTKFNGYESSFEDNNSFLVSFADLDSAVKWCIDVKNTLAKSSWPPTLKGEPKGLRVRMAVNTGAPNCHITQNAGNIHYFGPVVEKLSKILDAGSNGEILASESVVALLHTRDFGVQVSPFKAYYEIVANSLLKPMPEDVNLGRVTSFEDVLTPGGATPRNRTPNWVVDIADVSIKTLLGVGPLGECSKVTLNNHEMAMKMLGYQKMTENDVFMFICYGAMLSKIRHQNIVSYYGICIQPKSRCVFQELMERGSLQNILRNPSIDLPSERKLQFAIDIASGMHYLSLVDDEDISKNRNLKSCNCMVGKNWEVKIADFGLHKVKDVMQTITASVNVAWTAPEQFENETNTFSHASPVYSYGIILWEILTRKVPFAGVHPTRLVSLTLNGLRPEIPSGCPHPYQNLMERCWQAEPNKRPTWQEILNELHNMREYSKINIA